MSLTVTIHNGELKQIKQQIVAKSEGGQLFGLWTHSNQPVVQYITGSPKGDKNVDDFLKEKHALRHVGIWSTNEIKDKGVSKEKPPPSFVYMTVSLDKETLNVKLSVFENGANLNGVLEVLEGDSAFRLKNPFDRGLLSYHTKPVKGELDWKDVSPNPSRQAETKEEQWYSSQEGMQLFAKIHGALQGNFEITGTSRDKDTHDLSVTFKVKGSDLVLDFPPNFPHDTPILTMGRKGKKEIHLEEPSQEEKHPKDTKAAKGGKGKKKANVKESQDELQSEEKSQGQLDPDKVPQLLVEGILRHIEKKNPGTPV